MCTKPQTIAGAQGECPQAEVCCRHAGRIPIRVFPDSCCGSAHPPLLARPVRASRYTLPRACSPGSFIFLARPILVEGQVSLCIVVGFYAQCLNFSSPPGVGRNRRNPLLLSSVMQGCVFMKRKRLAVGVRSVNMRNFPGSCDSQRQPRSTRCQRGWQPRSTYGHTRGARRQPRSNHGYTRGAHRRSRSTHRHIRGATQHSQTHTRCAQAATQCSPT